MIIRIYDRVGTVNVQRRVMRVIRVYDRNIPSGISESEFTQKGGLLAGSGAGAFGELPPGSAGQYLTPDPTAPLGLKYETPSIAISDSTNFLINGGFLFAQRQTPGTLTTISNNAYSADRWKILRENADLQYQRNDATGETGLTSLYYGRYKKITNAGKFMVLQIIEGANSVSLRSKTVIFQVKMKASSAKTIRMAILELQTGGTIDTMPATPVSAWNVDSTDPTLGTNLAIVTGVESKSVTTTWENFSISVTVPATSKNVICAVWSDADFAANDTLDMAEAGLFLGASLLAWSPRLIEVELGLCRRYYWKSFDTDTGPAQNVSAAAIRFSATKAAAAAMFFQSLAVPLRLGATPTITTFNPYAANAQVRDVDVGGDCSVTAASYSGGWVLVSCTGNAGGAVGNRLFIHITAEADL